MNSETKNFKILLDDSMQDTFRNLLLNIHFTANFLKLDPQCDEFYVKDEFYTLYYLKINNLNFFTLFDKETTFDDINTVKTTLRAFQNQF